MSSAAPTADPKRYLVTVQLKGETRAERAHDIPLVVEWLRSFAKSEHEVAFRASNGLLFGFFIKTSRPHLMRAEFEKCPGTVNGDAVIIVEVGKLVDAVGFSPASTWLQRH
jgi:hypothetical protein